MIVVLRHTPEVGTRLHALPVGDRGSADLCHLVAVRRRGELRVVEVGVDAVMGQQLVVLATLHDPAVSHHQDLVRAPNR